MKVSYYGEEKEVYEVCKKGGKHQYYTIFDKEPVGVVNEDSEEIRTIKPKYEEFVKEIRLDFDSTFVYKIDEFPVSI